MLCGAAVRQGTGQTVEVPWATVAEAEQASTRAT